MGGLNNAIYIQHLIALQKAESARERMPREFRQNMEVGMSVLKNVESLKKTIIDSRFELALEAVESLDPNAGWAIKPLLEIYNNYYPKQKYLSALALIKLGEPRVIELLLRDLTALDKWGHRDGTLNVAAALALGSAERSPEIIEALRQALTEEEYIVGFVNSLGFIVPQLGLGTIVSYKLQEAAGLSLVKLGDKESGKQIVQLAVEDWHWHIPKEVFIQYMYASGWESTISYLASLLQGNPEIVVSYLDAIGVEQCVEPLTEALKHKTPNIRKKALKALANIGGERALTAIHQTTDDKNWGVRRTAGRMVKKLSKGK
jgi:HEAT repeat protein